jgi:hypothetical protein
MPWQPGRKKQLSSEQLVSSNVSILGIGFGRTGVAQRRDLSGVLRHAPAKSALCVKPKKLVRRETASAGRRGAGRLEFGGSGSGGFGPGRGYAPMDWLQEEGSRERLRMSPLGRDRCSAAIVITTTGVAEDELSGI